MNFIHKNGMIHRLENWEKIVDFGLVKNQWICHERVFICKPVNGKRNWHSCLHVSWDVEWRRVVLYFILYGVVPNQSLKDKSAGRPVIFPSNSDKISIFGKMLIEKCLSPDPANRPSFEEILNYIRNNSFKVKDDVESSIVKQRDWMYNEKNFFWFIQRKTSILSEGRIPYLLWYNVLLIMYQIYEYNLY